MCARLKTQLFLLIILFATGLKVVAQPLNEGLEPNSTKDNSPYSRFGIGDLGNPRNGMIRGMGGAATAYNDLFSVNSYNPATYSFLKVTTLDFALEGRSRSIFLNDISTTSGTATISYITIGIPLGKYAGMAAGITPMANVYYNSADTVSINGIGKTIQGYNGSGSLQYAYLGLSGQYKGFSIGFNAGYVFGTTRYTSTFQNFDTMAIRNSEFDRYNSVGGLYWKGGVLYKATLPKDHYLNIGAAITLSQKLNVDQDYYELGYLTTPDGTIIDTARKELGAKGKIELPAEYSFGIHYGKSFYWNVGADFVYTDWSGFSNMGDRSGVGNNAWRASVGGEITPSPQSRKMFSIATYRLGAYYGKDYIELNNTNITYVGGTIGASFPLKRSQSQFGRINTALDIGQRGTTQNGLAREFYVRFTLGVSLNDIWFVKRKFE